MTVTVALLLDDPSLLEWQRRTIAYLRAECDLDVEVSLIVINEAETESSLVGRLRTFYSKFSLWHCLVALRLVRRRVCGPVWYREQIPLETVFDLSEVSVRHCVPKPAPDFGNQLPESVVADLSEVDVAIRFGFGILKGEALSAPEYGVLSYHHGDITEYRGRPSGFYEFIHDEPTTGVTVQRITEDLDAGAIAASTRCDISTSRSLREVHSEQFRVSPPLLCEALHNLIADDSLEIPENLGPLYKKPSNRAILLYLWYRIRSL